MNADTVTEEQTARGSLKRSNAMAGEELERRAGKGPVKRPMKVEYLPETEEMDEDELSSTEEMTDAMPLDLDFFFDQFQLTRKERIAMCSKYAAYQRTLLRRDVKK